MASSPLISGDRPPPTTAAIAIASAILAGVFGFFIGQGASLGLLPFSSSSPKRRKAGAPKKSWPNSYDVKVHAGSSDEGEGGDDEQETDDEDVEEEEEEEEDAGELATFEGNTDEVKMVLVVRTDLGMGKGKIAAQCSHATLACYKYFFSKSPDSPILRRWERNGQAKVALQVKSEDELLMLQAQAISLGLCARVISDAGRTQIASGSRTVLGILGPKSIVDGVTGQLKLL